MRLRLLLPALTAFGMLLCFPAISQAGSFVVEGCNASWTGATNAGPPPTTSAWDGVNRYWLGYNAPTVGFSSSLVTSSTSTEGYRRLINSTNGPFYRSDVSETINSYSIPCNQVDSAGISGPGVRPTNYSTNGLNVYGVAAGTFAVRDFNTDGAGIVSVGGSLYTGSGAGQCILSEESDSGDSRCVSGKRKAMSTNQSDLHWLAGLFSNGTFRQGFKGDGSSNRGGPNDPSGKIASNGQPLAQTPSVPSEPTGFRLQITCGASAGCINSSNQNATPTIGPYSRAIVTLHPSWGSLPITLRDNNAGTATMAVPGGWVRGTRSVTSTGTDNSTGAGVLQVGARIGSDVRDGSTTSLNNSGATSCQSGRRVCTTTQSFDFDTTALANGPVSVYSRSRDDAGNGWVESSATTMYVDNSSPDSGGSCSSGLSVTPPSGNADVNSRTWITGTVTVNASACDPTSGIDNVKVQYQTLSPGSYSLNNLPWDSSWSDAAGSGCSSETDTGAGQPATLSCSFNTASFPEGTVARFRVWAEDMSTGQGGSAQQNALGNTSTSSPSAARYLDNTAPDVSNLRWEGYDDRANTWEEATTGWTNAKKTRLRWDALSPGNGSPIDEYFYLYDPDPDAQAEGSSSGTCAVQQPNGWQDATGVTASEPFNENRAEQCRQGTHQVWVWVSDVAGNGATKPDKTKAAGTSTVKYDSAPTPESRDEAWAKAQTLMPAPFKAYPTAMGLSGVGKWTTTNAFTLAWTNPVITNIKTESPIIKARYQVGGGSTVGDTVQDVQEYTDCLVSGQNCELSGIKAPSEGSHPVRMWLQDAAGNSSLEQSAVAQINWRDGTCVQP